MFFFPLIVPSPVPCSLCSQFTCITFSSAVSDGGTYSICYFFTDYCLYFLFSQLFYLWFRSFFLLGLLEAQLLAIYASALNLHPNCQCCAILQILVLIHYQHGQHCRYRYKY